MAALLFVAVAFAPAWLPAAVQRQNLLFILTEDQGAHLGFLGTPGLQTPNMDALARTGVYFDNTFVAYPVCSASKACIYTGLHNHANGILNNTLNYHKPASQLTAAERNQPLARNNRIRDGIPTLVERMHAAGYYQGVTSKLHVLPNEKFPYDETVKFKDRFPEQFRILAEMDPQSLGGQVPPLELYDLQADPDERRNLAGDAGHRAERDRLFAALRAWVQATGDPALQPPTVLPN